MLLFEYLINEAEGTSAIADSSGNGLNGTINPVRAGATPARVSAENIPNGYRFKAIKYDVDAMPDDHGLSREPDNQLQFLRVEIDDTIRNINTTKAFTISLWAYHKVKPKADPWDGPTTHRDRKISCPQHVCIDKSVYTFVRTKNIPPVVARADRGQLAFTGPGDPEVIGAGGIGNELGGVTSNDVHIPINGWIHLAFVLEEPSAAAPNDRGVWRSYINGDLVGELPSETALSAAGLEIIKPGAAVDIRFGNFRGNIPPDNRPPHREQRQ